MELCRIQWGSRNLSRAMFGDNSIFGLNEINFSLPIVFEYTDKPELYFSTKEVNELLSVNYLGHQSILSNSLMNFTNIQFLLDNFNDTIRLSLKFKISQEKCAALTKWIKNVLKSIRIIESENYEIAFFRGITY